MLKQIAKEFVKSFPCGRKENKKIEYFKKKYGKNFEEILEMKTFFESNLNQEQRKILSELMKPINGPIVYKKDNKYYVNDKIGECLRIVYSDFEEPRNLALLIAEEYWKRGVHVSLIPTLSSISRKHLQVIPEYTAAELPEPSKIFAEKFDARIFIGGDEDDNWIRGLESKQLLSAPSTQYLRQIMDKRKVRWCVFGWPIKKKKYYVKPEFYRKVFIESIKSTFSKEVKEYCNYYKKALEGCSEIKITANDGTELTFNIKNRPILVADGIIDENDMKNGDVGLNIPDGEVFLAPHEYSANGKIKFDFVATHGFGLIKNLWIEFKDGKVINFKADGSGTKRFKKFLDSNTGDKDRIAEFGIGTNPSAKFIGETIVDEKILGSIHIAIGSNQGAYHGKNVASSHLDMIKIMKGKQGNCWADGKLIMKDGMPNL
ncbi:MAG: aminopeptidase [Candidatus Aenigmatarchaeota archaeon]